jgi:hypothetical protein
MANPSGTNQFGGFSSEPAYGEVARTADLERSAPMSGAPLAASAKDAPRRAKRHSQSSGAGAGSAAGPAPVPTSITPDAEVLAVGQQLANDPEASDLLRQIVSQGR